MELLIPLLKLHPWLVIGGLAAMWLFNNVITAMIGNLPAPTKDSTAKYVYWFKVANNVVGNFQRAKSTAIENSPNFLPAVEKYVASRYGINLQNQEPRFQNTLGQPSQGVVTDWQQGQNK